MNNPSDSRNYTFSIYLVWKQRNQKQSNVEERWLNNEGELDMEVEGEQLVKLILVNNFHLPQEKDSNTLKVIYCSRILF